MAMPNGMKKETFEGLDIDSKLNVVFDYVSGLYKKQESEESSREESETLKEQHCQDRWQACDDRFKTIESRGNKLLGALVLLNVILPISVYFIT